MPSPQADKIHAAMLARPAHLFAQAELEALLDETEKQSLIEFMQELINHKLVKLAQSDSVLYYQAISQEEAEKIRGMSPDEAMVYSYIEAAGREGIWTKTIKVKSNLHQHVVVRCLKNLENQRYIKAVKSVKFPTRKIYMLYALQPSIEVTGGPWFTDSELDSEFIALLLRLVWQFVARATYPDALDNPTAQASLPPDYARYPSVDDIHDFVVNSGISTVELGPSDIRALCDVLTYDDKLEATRNDSYRATWTSVLAEQGEQPSRGLEGVLTIPEIGESA